MREGVWLGLQPYFKANSRSQEQALRLNEALQQVELALLDTHAERRAVLRRLATLGVTNAWQLLQLQHEEVAEWPGVGPAFLSVLDEMREEVHRAPEQLVDTWRREWAALTFPDDMEEETHIALSDADSAEEVPEKKSTDTEYECLSAEACEAERTLAALLHTLLHRRPVGAGVLRRYFLEGLPVSTIVRVEGLASRAAGHRVVDRQCLRPLLSGEALHGLQLSAAFLAKLEQLRGRLICCPSTVLECLHTSRCCAARPPRPSGGPTSSSPATPCCGPAACFAAPCSNSSGSPTS